MFKVLIAEPTHEILSKKLVDCGFTCEYIPVKSNEELLKIINKYQGLVIRSRFKINSEFIDLASSLKFIARAGSGMENIDVAYANKKGITCLNSPEGNRDSVGEHSVGMILSLLHKLQIANTEVKKGLWDRISNIGTELGEKTVGILGYGNMGSAVAKRLSGFDTNVIAYDKYKFDYSDDFVKEVSLEKLYEQTDILSIHVPLTDETNGMINDTFINNFEKDIIIINTARGKVLNTNDLVKNLKTGKVRAAALDVLEYEKSHFETIVSGKNSETFNYLIQAENIILTPHVAGSSVESYRKIAEVLAEKIINLYSRLL